MARSIKPGGYEAGYGSPDWRAQHAASWMAAERFRNNSFFPNAARQVAEADAIAGVPQGGLPGMYGAPGARPMSPVSAVPTVAEQYQKGYEKYKKDTEQHRKDVMSSHDARRADALALLTAKGPPTAEEIALQRNQREAMTRLAASGLAGGTLVAEQNDDFKRATENLDYNRRERIADRMADFDASRLRTMEDTQFVAPDIAQLIALEQAQGKGSTEGLAQPASGGMPVIHGNPYGMGGGMRRPVGGQGAPAQAPAPAGYQAPPAGGGIAGGVAALAGGNPAGGRMASYAASRAQNAARTAQQKALVANPAYAAAAREAAEKKAYAPRTVQQPYEAPIPAYAPTPAPSMIGGVESRSINLPTPIGNIPGGWATSKQASDAGHAYGATNRAEAEARRLARRKGGATPYAMPGGGAFANQSIPYAWRS